MAKKLVGTLKLQVPAGQANPSPPVGPALGQRGINIMEFCKAFNAKTGDMEPGAPCPTVIEYFQDKSFSMTIKTPPASYYIRKAAKLKSGSNKPGLEVAGSVSLAQIREIAEAKMEDLNATNIDGAMQIIIGSARSMGIEVK
jgi:large subunit ribosomal protein L11